MLILLRLKDYQGTDPDCSNLVFILNKLMGDNMEKLAGDCIQIQPNALQCSLKQTMSLIVPETKQLHS